MPFAQVIENDYCIEIKLKFYLLSEKCIGGDISEDLDGESFFLIFLSIWMLLEAAFYCLERKLFFFFSLYYVFQAMVISNSCHFKNVNVTLGKKRYIFRFLTLMP